MSRSTAIAALAALAALALAALFLAWPAGPHWQAWPESFASNGERLYFTGRSTRGTRMVPSGGDRHMMMMGGAACAACHGADRQGGRVGMSFWTRAPALTPAALAGEHDDDDGHDHAGYTPETLARAITRGVDAGGEPLDPAMPRWSMSEADLDDLVDELLGEADHGH